LYTGPGGGLYTGPSGGMYTGPDQNPYMAIHPPWPLFVKELQKLRKQREAKIIEEALRGIGWRI
ncbi:multiple banded antigen, partial [Bacillus stratosphericus]